MPAGAALRRAAKRLPALGCKPSQRHNPGRGRVQRVVMKTDNCNIPRRKYLARGLKQGLSLTYCQTAATTRGRQSSASITRGSTDHVADLPWRSWLVPHRSGMRKALGSNPGSEEIWTALNIEVLRTNVDEVSMECHRNARAGEKGDFRENPPTSGIVRHNSHMGKSGATPPGIEPDSPWWEVSTLATKPPRLLRLFETFSLLRKSWLTLVLTRVVSQPEAYTCHSYQDEESISTWAECIGNHAQYAPEKRSVLEIRQWLESPTFILAGNKHKHADCCSKREFAKGRIVGCSATIAQLLSSARNIMSCQIVSNHTSYSASQFYNETPDYLSFRGETPNIPGLFREIPLRCSHQKGMVSEAIYVTFCKQKLLNVEYSNSDLLNHRSWLDKPSAAGFPIARSRHRLRSYLRHRRFQKPIVQPASLTLHCTDARSRKFSFATRCSSNSSIAPAQSPKLPARRFVALILFQSPDLEGSTYPDTRVYATLVDDVCTLRNRIVAGCETMRNFPRIHQCIRVSIQQRVDACVRANGGHFEYFV
ncbi:hypothetical protein PR048_009975 [Dryococelus australis]|uniref:Uncharacterized protein n=1 Tax=Dryococelus australis TaxID=614101 RepID=A0ABQ9I256_9NEOP|nr:hypothetical protein PR048_009975 [Dryococelus australis]